MMNEQELRLECLRLAYHPDSPADAVVNRAERFWDYVSGRAQKTPRQIINEMLDKADAIG